MEASAHHHDRSTAGLRPADVLEVDVLGPLRIGRGDRRVELASRLRPRLLLALLVERGSAVPAERLIELLWGADPPEAPRKALQIQVSRLRSELGAVGDGGAGVIVTEPAGYRLEPEHIRLDSDRFEELVEWARRSPTDPGRVVDVLDEALGLWRGRAFGEWADDPLVLADAQRLEELRLQAIEERSEALLALGRSHEVVADLAALVRREPTRERPRGQLMRALHQQGRTAAALSQYRDLRAHLVENLGIEPSASLQDLEVRLLRGDPTLAPASTSLRAGGQVPSTTGPLVGRRDLLHRVGETVATARLVTLTGPGGVGKTRLAVELARDVSRARVVWWCDLAPLDDPAAVVPAVATTLGVQERVGSTWVDVIVDALSGQHPVVVFDNCEHVAPAVSELAERIVTVSPDTSVLATSREPLGLPGERVHHVPPLDAGHPGSPAVELLADRAGVDAAGETAHDPDSLAALCRRLDGLPLAIELVAPQLRTMTADELLAGLDDAELRAPRSSLRRHDSLAESIGWSHRRLDEPARLVFERSSVFAGPFGPDDAAAVCGGSPIGSDAVRPLLTELVDRSMLQVDLRGATSRHRMLETLRRYGRARLVDRGEAGRVDDAFLGHFVALADEAGSGVRGAQEVQWTERLDAAFDNLRAAQHRLLDRGDVDRATRLAVALYDYGQNRTRDEVFGWVRAANDATRARGRRPAPAALAVEAHGRAIGGDLTGARALARRAVDEATSSDRDGRPLALRVLATVALNGGRLEECVQRTHEHLSAARDAGDPYEQASALLRRTLALTYLGRTDAALAAARAQTETAEATGNPSQRAWAMYSHGEVLRTVDPEGALALLDRSIELAETVANRYVAGMATVSAASTRGRHGEPRHALEALAGTLRRWRAMGDRIHLWPTLRCVVELLTRAGHAREAASLHAAVGAGNPGPVYGEDVRRVAEVEAELRRRLGPTALRSALAPGEHVRPDEVVDVALAAIARAVEPSGESG